MLIQKFGPFYERRYLVKSVHPTIACNRFSVCEEKLQVFSFQMYFSFPNVAYEDFFKKVSHLLLSKKPVRNGVQESTMLFLKG